MMTLKMPLWTRAVVLMASSFCILLGGTLALYPGAKLDQDFEKGKPNNPHSELKQYITLDSYEKVQAYYKKLAPEAPGSTINQPGHKRMAFREKGDELNSTTIEWSNEDAEDKNKTFILVDIHK